MVSDMTDLIKAPRFVIDNVAWRPLFTRCLVASRPRLIVLSIDHHHDWNRRAENEIARAR